MPESILYVFSVSLCQRFCFFCCFTFILVWLLFSRPGAAVWTFWFFLFSPVAALYDHGTDICMFSTSLYSAFPPRILLWKSRRFCLFQERCASEHPSSVWSNVALISPPDRTWASLTLNHVYPQSLSWTKALYSHMRRSLWYLELFNRFNLAVLVLKAVPSVQAAEFFWLLLVSATFDCPEHPRGQVGGSLFSFQAYCWYFIEFCKGFARIYPCGVGFLSPPSAACVSRFLNVGFSSAVTHSLWKHEPLHHAWLRRLSRSSPCARPPPHPQPLFCRMFYF